MEGVIYKKVTEYNDVLAPVRDYRRQIANIIRKLKGVSNEEANRIAINIIKKNYKPRRVSFFSRMENGDREFVRSDLFAYLQHHVSSGNIIAPSLTTYTPPHVKRSKWASFTLENVIVRAKQKKESQEAFALGDIERGIFMNGSQNNQKTKNNTLSGLYLSPTSVLYNPTSHSTLTSMTRTMTSLTNATNERLLTGNRALYTPEYALNSIVNEAEFCNKPMIAKAIEEFNLHIPTNEEIVKMLRHSSDLYNRDMNYYRKWIIPYIETLTDEERAGVMYTIDLYHLWMYNYDFVNTLLTELTKKVYADTDKMDDPSKIYDFDMGIRFFAHNIFSVEVRGLGTDYERYNEAGVASHIYATCKNIEKTMLKYKTFFQAFYMTEIRPINSHRLQYMRRKTVALSDTDSSGFDINVPLRIHKKKDFDYAEAVFDAVNEFKVDGDSIALSGALVYISSETIVQQLSRLSKSMNVEEKELRRISMKNEWFWTVFCITQATKHYFADAYIQEGNVKPETERETKGVDLLANHLPDDIKDMTYRLMGEFLYSIRDHGEAELDRLIRESLKIENSIIESLEKGEVKYLGTQKINGENSYKKGPMESPYRHHHLWKSVFEPKYGEIPEPSYLTVKIPTTLTSKGRFNDWLEGIEDPDFRERMRNWTKKANRVQYPLFMIEYDYIKSNGIPEEVKSVMDIEQIVLSLTKQLKMIMTTFGLIVDEKKLLRDQFFYPEEKKKKE